MAKDQKFDENFFFEHKKFFRKRAKFRLGNQVLQQGPEDALLNGPWKPKMGEQVRTHRIQVEEESTAVAVRVS